MSLTHTEYMREYMKRPGVREKVNARWHELYGSDPVLKERARARANKWYADHTQEVLAKRKAEYPQKAAKAHAYKLKWKAAAIARFGGKCCKCGFSDARALQFDHISGNGAAFRKENRNYSFHYRRMALFPEAELIFQLLCANCNWIKRWENNECNQFALPVK